MLPVRTGCIIVQKALRVIRKFPVHLVRGWDNLKENLRAPFLCLGVRKALPLGVTAFDFPHPLYCNSTVLKHQRALIIQSDLNIGGRVGRAVAADSVFQRSIFLKSHRVSFAHV